jgi:hypothetical protein
MSEQRTVIWPTPSATTGLSGGSGAPWKVRGISQQQWMDEQNAPPAPTVSPQLTLFAEAFPVSRTRLLVDEADLRTSATSGPSSCASFASVNPDGSWRKTCQGYSQVTLDGSLAVFSETWPRAGMTRNGTAYQRPPSAPLTGEIECGSWPTPRNCTAMAAAFTENTAKAKFPNLETVVAQRQWPTPASRDYRSPSLKVGTPEYFRAPSAGIPLPEAVGGSLNPTWVEWLMGYPLGWTACAGWATRSSRRSPSGSRGASSRRKGVK